MHTVEEATAECLSSVSGMYVSIASAIENSCGYDPVAAAVLVIMSFPPQCTASEAAATTMAAR